MMEIASKSTIPPIQSVHSTLDHNKAEVFRKFLGYYFLIHIPPPTLQWAEYIMAADKTNVPHDIKCDKIKSLKAKNYKNPESQHLSYRHNHCYYKVQCKFLKKLKEQNRGEKKTCDTKEMGCVAVTQNHQIAKAIYKTFEIFRDESEANINPSGMGN